MKVIFILLIATGLYANDINISFGCYDCKDKKEIIYEKEVKKYTENISTLADKIEINGSIEIAFEKNKD